MKIIQNWHFFSNKYHINLFVLFAVLCLGNLEIKAQFTFNPTDFIVVDNTIKPYAVPGTNYRHLDSTRYRLTKGHILHGSNQQYISVALWHNKKINLQDNSFLFTCYLNFDNLVGGADGLAFVLHNIEPYDNLIGEDGGFLGYGHTTTTTNTNSVVAPQIISPSFAIEFDTYSEAADPYDGEAYDCNAYQHINYLQDANMYSGCSVAPVGNLKDGLDHCVNIFWKQTNGVDGSSGYDMITYMDGVMYMNKHYASVSDLVDGATDSVTFGITAACGMKTNTQQVEFVELRNGKNIADTVGLIRIGDIWRHAYNSIPDTNNLAQIGHYWEYIPMYSNVIETTCGTISLNNSLFGVDTVYFGKNLAPFCYNQTKQIKIYLGTELDMSNAQWSFKKNDTFEIVAVGTKHLYVDSLLDIVNMSDNRIDTLLVRLVVDNDTLYFSIPYYNI